MSVVLEDRQAHVMVPQEPGKARSEGQRRRVFGAAEADNDLDFATELAAQTL